MVELAGRDSPVCPPVKITMNNLFKMIPEFNLNCIQNEIKIWYAYFLFEYMVLFVKFWTKTKIYHFKLQFFNYTLYICSN